MKRFSTIIRITMVLIAITLIISITLVIYIKPFPPKITPIINEEQQLKQRLLPYVTEALTYSKQHQLDEEHTILIDFSIHSGKYRFFVWNHTEKRVELASLAAHGYGNIGYQSSQSEIIFSNIPNSYASSLGKYRLGARSYSKWGVNFHYKLHGLEKSNDNAYQRYIVLHSYKDIPAKERYPLHLSLGYSQGCPVIDDATMIKIDQLIKKKSKPMLLWIYQS